MHKNLLLILGTLLFQVSLVDIFLIYFNIDIPFSVLIVFILFCSLFILLISKVKILKDKKFIVYFIILFICIVFATTINTNYDISKDYLLYYTRVLQIFVILISLYLVVNNVDLLKFIKVNSLICFFGSLLYIFFFWKEHLLARPEGVLNISDSLAFLGIILFNLKDTEKFRYIIFLISLLLLLFYSSFTSITFFLLVISLNILHSFYSNKNIIIKIFITLILTCLIIFVLAFYFQISSKVVKFKGDSVFVNTINNYLIRIHYVINFDDVSLNLRSRQFEKGFQVLKEKPILGEFMYEYRVFGDTGSYMHNILSYWAEYGLINFSLIFVPYFIYLHKSYKYFVRYDIKILKALFFAGIYITLVLLFSRSYTHMIFWIHYGLMMSYVLKFEREMRKQARINYAKPYEL